MQETPTIWGFSIFCDDIRQEFGGKYSIIGVYSSDLIFEGEFPLIIPKLGVVVKYYEKADSKLSSDVIISVHIPSDDDKPQSITQTVPRSDFNNGESGGVISITVPFIMSPVLINTSGIIKVKAEVGGEVIGLGTLIVRQARIDESRVFLK